MKFGNVYKDVIQKRSAEEIIDEMVNEISKEITKNK